MSKVYTCILIDDELLALSYLRTLCEELPEIRVLKAYDDPHRLLEELPQLSVDFCISDIVMPSMTGLELAQQLGGMPVIFTTAHNEFAADAFDIDAVDYLRKPVKKDRLKKAIEKAIQQLEARETKSVQLQVTTHQGKMILSTDQLLSLSSETADRRDKLALLKNGEEWILKNSSFDHLLGQLPEGQFCRISKGEVIALGIVTGHSGTTIFTSVTDKSGKAKAFTLSESYRKSFVEQLRQHVG